MAIGSLTLPIRQSAVIANDAGELVVIYDAQLPELEPDRLLIQTVAVAINQVDVKLSGAMATPRAGAGTDCAGIVLAIGSAVPTDTFKIGDRICAPVTPMNPLSPRDGAFAEYTAVVADFALKVPGNMSMECAASLGLGIATIGYALFRSLGIPGHPESPASKSPIVLVYGGSTSSGTMAIQLLRRSGCIPITTCSPKNFALVKSYGAEAVWDYNDVDSVKYIKEYTRNSLDFALDCHCQASSIRFCYNVIGRAGGRYTTLEPYPQHQHTRKRVKADWILALALLGKPIGWKEPYNLEANPQLREFGKKWFNCAQNMLNDGLIRPHPVRIGTKSGLEAVLEGIKLLGQKTVSGEKLVYYI